jgi:hypothetical protein
MDFHSAEVIEGFKFVGGYDPKQIALCSLGFTDSSANLYLKSAWNENSRPNIERNRNDALSEVRDIKVARLVRE